MTKANRGDVVFWDGEWWVIYAIRHNGKVDLVSLPEKGERGDAVLNVLQTELRDRRTFFPQPDFDRLARLAQLALDIRHPRIPSARRRWKRPKVQPKTGAA